MVRKIAMAIGCVALLAGGPALARDKDKAPDKVMPNGDPIVCKTSQDTGSLVRKTKRCYTRAQWERIADAARGNGQRLQTDHATSDLGY